MQYYPEIGAFSCTLVVNRRLPHRPIVTLGSTVSLDILEGVHHLLSLRCLVSLAFTKITIFIPDGPFAELFEQ